MKAEGPSDEFGQLAVIVQAMNGLHEKAQRRVMAYLVDRYGNGQPGDASEVQVLGTVKEIIKRHPTEQLITRPADKCGSPYDIP